jgi:beta-phosphoglucomutase family hydrolase
LFCGGHFDFEEKYMKAVIFDMDGVLVDSQPYHFKADIDTMAEYGVIKGQKFYESFAGTLTADRMRTLKEMFGLDVPVEEMTIKRENMILDIMGKEDIKPVSGIPEFLRSIKEKGLTTAVASSSDYKLINLILDRLKIAKYFDSVTSGSDVKRGKPSPDVFLLAAERIGIEPAECLVVEDSENGVKAAKAAGMKALGYINPTSGKQDLSLADFITDDFKKISIDMFI